MKVKHSFIRNLCFFYFSICTILSIFVSPFADRADHPVIVNKKGFINVYFAKKGWAWTFIAVSSILIKYQISKKQKTQSRYKSMIRHNLSVFKALIQATLYWFFMTQWFFGNPLLDRIFHWWPWAQCELKHELLRDYHSCNFAGYQWVSLDISGHCFLLMHSSMTIWNYLVNFMDIYDVASFYSVNCSNIDARVATLIMLNFVPIIILIIWLYSLIVTCIFFHDTPEKLIASCLAISFWLLRSES